MSNQIPENKDSIAEAPVKNDTEKNKWSSNYSWYGLIVGLPFAVVYGMLFDNFAIGLLWGISFGLIFSTAFKEEEKDTETKASQDENNDLTNPPKE
jgi:hypothetical protein